MRFHKTLSVTLVVFFTSVAHATAEIDQETCFRIRPGAIVTFNSDLAISPYVSEITVEGLIPLRGRNAQALIEIKDADKMGRYRVIPSPRLQVVRANTKYVVKSVDFDEGRMLTSEPMYTPIDKRSAISKFFLQNAEPSATHRFGVNLTPLNGTGPDLLAPCPGWLSIGEFKARQNVEVEYRN